MALYREIKKHRPLKTKWRTKGSHSLEQAREVVRYTWPEWVDIYQQYYVSWRCYNIWSMTSCWCRRETIHLCFYRPERLAAWEESWICASPRTVPDSPCWDLSLCIATSLSRSSWVRESPSFWVHPPLSEAAHHNIDIMNHGCWQPHTDSCAMLRWSCGPMTQ